MNKIDRLKNLDSDKLIDVVKNYRQYDYEENLRTEAIIILEERGISKEQLLLTGNFENNKYENAEDLYNSFTKNSKITLAFYGIIFLTNLLSPMILKVNESVGFLILILGVGSLIFFLVFFIKSFMNQNQFYISIGQEFGTEGALLYLFLGMPLYFLMYFYFQNQMKQKMKEIR
ncbi:hypothetical protein ACXR6G_05600 [Ancylomarina sp. YFZ004]